MVVGKGAAFSQEDAQLRGLIDATGLPFLATAMGRGVVSDSHGQVISTSTPTTIVEPWGMHICAKWPYLHCVSMLLCLMLQIGFHLAILLCICVQAVNAARSAALRGADVVLIFGARCTKL